MGIISWLLLGLAAGWIASVIMKSNSQQGMLADIIMGVLGALVGGYVYSWFGGTGVTGLNLYSLVIATIGAIALIALRRLFFGRKGKQETV